MNSLLDFEQPIAELFDKLDETKKLGEETGADVSSTIKDLEKLIIDKKKEIYSNLTPWQRVLISRHPDRPYSLAYIEAITEGNFIELHGDRGFKDDKAIVGGFGQINGKTVMLIGHQKGINTKMRQYRNFGMPNPEGYRKALRLMKLAEKFNKPVVTFIDTPGAFPGLEAEERGQGEAIARNLYEMAQLKVPILCFILGEGASGGALGIGVGDHIFMLENAWYSVISPESCSSILWRNWEHKEQAAQALKLTAKDMLKNKMIDSIISEPEGGAHHKPDQLFASVKQEIIKHLTKLKSIKPNALVTRRIKKFSEMGVYKNK